MKKAYKIILSLLLMGVIIFSFVKIFAGSSALVGEKEGDEAVELLTVDSCSFSVENTNNKILIELMSDKSITEKFIAESNEINVFNAQVYLIRQYDALENYSYDDVTNFIIAEDEKSNEKYVCVMVPDESEYALVGNKKIELKRITLSENENQINLAMCSYSYYANEEKNDLVIVDKEGNKHSIN